MVLSPQLSFLDGGRSPVSSKLGLLGYTGKCFFLLNSKTMKSMWNFLVLNYIWIILAVIGLGLVIFAATKFRTPVAEIPTTKSANFSEDTVAGNPVMADNPYANIFFDAAQAAIYDGENPWIYLRENWEKAQDFKGVEPALVDFIKNQAHQEIPDSAVVSLSVRDYSDPNSIVMEYRDPATDSIMVTTGHDPEPALYATFAGKKDTATFKLICANGLVRELGGKTTCFEQDHLIRFGESFISITGATVHQATKFAEENDLPVRFVLEGKVTAKTPNTSKVQVYADYRNYHTGIYDVVLQPGNILRKQNNKWLYVIVSN